MKKRLEATQTLRAGCSKTDPQTNIQTDLFLFLRAGQWTKFVFGQVFAPKPAESWRPSSQLWGRQVTSHFLYLSTLSVSHIRRRRTSVLKISRPL